MSRRLLSITVFLMFISWTAEAQLGYSPRSLIFRAYIDGGVYVEYTVSVDATRVRVNITLFGTEFQELTVEDQEGLPLFYTPIEGGLTVDTLGSTTVTITYLTFDLTNKTGRIWTLSAQAPTSAVVVLPRNSTVVGLGAIPLSIGSLDGSPVLTMPEGHIEVSYIISLEGTRERALLAIDEAEATIKAVEARGVVAKEAEALLKEAQAAFKAGDYSGAERLSEKAKASALEAEKAASAALKAIEDASSKIEAARREGRTIGLEGAESLLKQAEEAYRIGDYGKSEALAGQAEAAAAMARTPLSPLLPLSIGAASAIIIGAILYILRRRRTKRAGKPEGLSLEEFLERRPDLRFEDREVLRFLAESGGEAFASEIRERFNMPRTSAWRLIRRLRKEGLVEVEEVGGQTLVKLKKRGRGK
ncbi:MAG: MarR family transcriptional regulator [Candidatus Bathyarchaeia archaeon]